MKPSRIERRLRRLRRRPLARLPFGAFLGRRGGQVISWILRDEFTTALAAGAVNGTPPVPGPGGNRSVTDTDSDLSITGGEAVFTASNSTYGDPGLWYDSLARVAGRVIVTSIRNIDVGPNETMFVGFFSDKVGSSGANGQGIRFHGTNDEIGVYNPSLGPAVGTYAATTAYKFATILRSPGGGYHFVKGGAFANWTLIWVDSVGTVDPLFPGIENRNQDTPLVDWIRIPDDTYLPTPIGYFTATTVPTSVDSGSNGLDGAYTRCGLGGSGVGAFFDGANSYNNIYSAALNTAFDGQEFGAFARAKIRDTAAWDIATFGNLVGLRVDASNYLFFGKRASAANPFEFRYVAGGTLKNDITAHAAPSGYFGAGMRVTLTSDEATYHVDGANFGVTDTGLGTWAGSLDSNRSVIGADLTTPTTVFPGWIADVVITLNGVVPTEAEMNWYTDVSNTITAAQLDSDFGAGNWAWWKQDEQYSTDTSGPDAQDTPALTIDTDTGAIDSGDFGVTPVPGSELLTNGNMESGDPPSSWTAIATTLDGVADERTGGSGSQSIDVARNGSPNFRARQNIIGLTIGTWFITSGWVRNVDADQARLSMYEAGDITLIAAAAYISGTTWTQFAFTYRIPTTSIFSRLDVSSTGADGTSARFDDVSVKQLTLSSTIASVLSTTLDVFPQVDMTITDDTQAGLMLRLDDPDNPQAFVHVYCDRTSGDIIVADVTGATTYTVRSTTAFTYSAGAELRVDLEGTNYRVYYNKAFIVSGTNISTATGAYTALFATDSATRFDNFLIMPKGSENDEYSQLDKWSF